MKDEAPFYVDPFVGFKGFLLGYQEFDGVPLLQSTVRRQVVWYPAQRSRPSYVEDNLLRATCEKPTPGYYHPKNRPVPDEKCTCGMWAYRTLEDAKSDVYLSHLTNTFWLRQARIQKGEDPKIPKWRTSVSAYSVMAVVWVWGRVFVNEITMRGEYMRIAALCSDTAADPAHLSAVSEAFSVPLVPLEFIRDHAEALPGILCVPGREY
ncbi:MAG: hypothetical protein M3P49_00760 [Actinomycetota bacterium]|nr:hypothetical protein [Actinomycetota bacterium]